MFSNIKKILIYSTVIAVPFGIIAIVIKYFYNKSSGKDASVEETIIEATAFIKKIVNFYTKVKK